MAEDVPVRKALGALAAELLEALRLTPDPDAALVRFARYLGARAAKVIFLGYLHDDPRALQVLTLVLGTSPYLSEILIRNPEYLHWLLARIDRAAAGAIKDDSATQAALARGDFEGAVDALKRFKRRELLGIATRDLLQRQSLAATTAQLSDLAALVVERTLAVVTRHMLVTTGAGRLPGTFAVIGMGKLGGGELNYSSDIDLLYVYEVEDEENPRAHEVFHRLARLLTGALGEHTQESYLYRVDLRLRPMGRRGAVAYDLHQYQQYYETWGETFERLALIKARPIAGDADLGRRFVSLVQPFVYRRYLDYAALEEMFRYKTRSDHALLEGKGERNVKLGRGGIREVELFTQILQLIYGGAHPELRATGTLTALDALRRSGFVSPGLSDQLGQAYVFLRTVEHRLQMVHQAQTHTLSDAHAELETTARRLGFAGAGDLTAMLRAHRDRVHEAYAGLLEQERRTNEFAGRQFFRILSGDLSDDQALAHVKEYGFADPAAVLRVVRTLGESTFDAPVRSTARNLLANLLAVWTPHVARSTRPERVLTWFEQFAAHSGVRTELYRTLLESDGVRAVLTDVLDAGDLLAQRLVRYPELLDSLLGPPADLDTLRRTFAARLGEMADRDPFDRLNHIRRFKQVEEFKILVRWLAGDPLADLQERLSLLAECSVEQAARWHAPVEPPVPDDGAPAWTVVALGKLGGHELGVHSDLDLVVLYDGEPSDAARFARYQAFVERTLAALEQPTAEGIAYRIDTRLRPEGTKGSLAMPAGSLRRYFETRADPWERLAWTRARLLAGSAPSRQAIRAAIDEFVFGPWDPALPSYMEAVRTRMERERAHEGDRRVDFKVGRGGLADVDFLVQLVQIREGHLRPHFRIAGTRALLWSLPPTDFLTLGEIVHLQEAYSFLRQLETWIRLDADSNVTRLRLDASALDPLGTRFGFMNQPGERLAAKYHDTTERVRSIYRAVLRRLA